MNTLAGTVVVFLAACAASGALSALVWRAAPRLGFTDKPDTCRKIHKRPTPLGGGFAVYVATIGVLVAWCMVPGPFRPPMGERWPDLIALLLAGAVIVTVGLVDDRVGLRGRHKLLAQIAAASIVMAGGLVIQKIELFGWPIALGPLSLPFTLFWLLGGINALNLMDGIDGLATMLGLILVFTIGAMAVITGSTHVAVVAIVFAGSLLGFLPFNFPPARVFLGDAGSMLIGPAEESPQPLSCKALTTISKNRKASSGALPSAGRRHEWPRLAATPRRGISRFSAPSMTSAHGVLVFSRRGHAAARFRRKPPC